MCRAVRLPQTECPCALLCVDRKSTSSSPVEVCVFVCFVLGGGGGDDHFVEKLSI